MQTTSGKVKLATAEEVDNMASSISGGLGGTLVGTTSAYITKNLDVSLPAAGDYVIVKSLTFGDFGGDGGANRTGIKTNSGVTLLYKGGTGYIAAAAAAAASASTSTSASTSASASAAAAAAATLNASGTSINFKSNLGNYNFNTYVNIEIYKFK